MRRRAKRGRKDRHQHGERHSHQADQGKSNRIVRTGREPATYCHPSFNCCESEPAFRRCGAIATCIITSEAMTAK